MKTILLFSLICTLTSGCNVSISTGSDKDQPVATAGTQAQNIEAFEAAKGIVHMIDDGKYEQVWENSSQLLKDMTPQFALTGMLTLTRKNLGTPSPRGAPLIGFLENIDGRKGEFCVVEVDTPFDKKVAHEKIVMVKESGAWKLAGYFINTRL